MIYQKKWLLPVVYLAIISNSFAQTTAVEVADLTLKIAPKSEETLYYAFAEGDQILFSYTETNGKDIREVAVLEYPNTLKFKDIDRAQTAEKRLYVAQKGVYVFAFRNNALLAARTVKVHLQRVPASSTTRQFGTAVQWQTRQDTTFDYPAADWQITDLATTKRTLTKQDTQIMTLFDRTERIDGKYVLNGKNETTISFALPQNTYAPDAKNPYQSTELVSWAYWLGVGQESSKGFIDQNKKLVGVVSSAAKLAGPYGILAGLAIDGVSVVAGSSPLGDNVQYTIWNDYNRKKTTIDTGNGTLASAKNTTQLQGTISCKLFNDNLREGIDVTLKAIAVQVRRTYEDRTTLTPQYTPKHKNAARRMTLKAVKVPVF
jgi:hypothetical protein